jgi:hypothetical protein
MMQLAVVESPKGVGSSARLPRDVMTCKSVLSKYAQASDSHIKGTIQDMIMLLNTVPSNKLPLVK